MNNTPKSASEKVFQENFVKELNRINADQLEGLGLTDNEFSQVFSKVNQIKSSYEAAEILSAENSVGKITWYYRNS